jgi:hypothetical protein
VAQLFSLGGNMKHLILFGYSTLKYKSTSDFVETFAFVVVLAVVMVFMVLWMVKKK